MWHIINRVIEIKNKIMKRKLKIKLPFSVYPFLAAVIISFSIYISTFSFLPQKVIFISTLFAMPEGMAYRISQLKDEFIKKFFNGDGTEFIQNGGSMNELIRHRNFSDLTVTPEDIIENIEKVQKLFEDGKYVYDGVTVERTFTDNQASDSFENIHVRNVTENSQIDIESIIKTGCLLPIDDFSEPVVLIYHTHSTESYIMTDNGEFS